MNTTIEPYLFFDGNAEDAIAFYREHLGAELEMLMRFSESPDPVPEGMLAPGFEDKIMHASLKIGASRIMLSDGCGGDAGAETFTGFSLSLAFPDETAARNAFNALSQDGNVTMPISKTFWSPCFGMLTDRFGIGWMVTIQEPGK